MPLSRYLELLAGLKWTLTVRHFQRHTGSAVMSIIALSITTLILLTGLAVIGLYRGPRRARQLPLLDGLDRHLPLAFGPHEPARCAAQH